jgi:hypothetical protein
MKLDASNDPAVRDFERWVRGELHGPVLGAAERERRRRNYQSLCDLMTVLTGDSRDDFEAATYSELIALALVALTAEQERLRPKGDKSR